MTDSREERVARIIELAIIRHGIEESALEGTLDDAAEVLALIELSPDVSRESEWQPIETAKRDGTPVLVKLRDDIYPGLRPERADLKGWNGITAVMRNRGDPSDWCFAAPVGHGGFPDEWMVGWKHTDPPKATTEGEE